MFKIHPARFIDKVQREDVHFRPIFLHIGRIGHAAFLCTELYVVNGYPCSFADIHPYRFKVERGVCKVLNFDNFDCGMFPNMNTDKSVPI